jgi:hypothetical protein
VYRDEENPTPWKEEDEEEIVVNYMKPLETPKPPKLVEQALRGNEDDHEGERCRTS